MSKKPSLLGPHSKPIGDTQTWLTPLHVLNALGGPDSFDLDPCCASPMPWRTAKKMIHDTEDGLSAKWEGRVWCNPPYGRKLIDAWVDRMCFHNNGLMLVFSRTDVDWAQQAFDCAAAVLFVKGRITFCTPDGNPCIDPKTGRESPAGAPSMVLAFGEQNIPSLFGLEGRVLYPKN